MDWLTERQAVLAQNLANVDTPNFKTKDLAQPDFKRVLEANGIADRSGALRPAGSAGGTVSGPVRLATTNPGHIAHGSNEVRIAAHAARGTTTESAPLGNDANLKDQVSKVTET